MKVSLRWMQDYIDLPTTDPEELAAVFASLGHQVEGYEVLAPTFAGVVVGKVLTVAAHPDADRIRLCTVDTGTGVAEVVCGAWNFDAGAVVPVAVPGATLDSGAFEITRRTIRGVVSNGMICSAHELGLGADRDGILVLDPGLPIGSDFGAHVELPDVVFDLSITPNRPDAMSMVGLARDLSAYYRIPVKMPDTSDPGGTGSSPLTVTIEDARCLRFTARQVDSITIGRSPHWMQQRLTKAGVRSISNVVDVSNYVMLELGQPTHAFDFDKVRGAAIVVRSPRDGERLTTLDGTVRELNASHLVVADAEVASSLAGTMGGEESEVSDSTMTVLVEVAAWDPATVMKMSRGFDLHSEASSRFERGVDPNLPPAANHRMCRLLSEIAGGTITGDLIDVYPAPIEPWAVPLSVAEVARTLGDGIGAEEVTELLTRLRFGLEGSDPFVVTVPTFRPDVRRGIDLVEEIARLRGFESFGETLPAGAGGGLGGEIRRERRLRSILLGAGLSEAQTFSFHGAEALARLGLPEGDLRRSAIEVRNPLREEESLLRTTLLPGLLGSARYNLSHGLENVALFEVGRVFYNEESPELGQIPHQPKLLAFVMVGETDGGGVRQQPAPVDVFHATGLVRLLADQLQLATIDLEDEPHPPLHPARSAVVTLDGSPIGFVGELHPRVARAWELPGRVAVGELQLAPLLEDRGLWQFSEPSTYPPSEFDLAFEVDDSMAAAALMRVVGDGAGELLESIRLFDEFKGGRLAEGRKSLALRLRLRSPDRTLTSDDVAESRAGAIGAADRAGATLRGA